MTLGAGVAPAALGQVSPPATATAPTTRPVPRGVFQPALRQATTLTQTQQDQIRTAVKLEVAAMAAPDAAVSTAARRNLVLSSSIPKANSKPTPATPAYQQAYASALNDALLTLTKSPDARVRLNGAVALASVAGNMSQGTTLEKATLAMLSDTSEPVVLWGVRAAREIYPYLLDTARPQAAEVAKAVQTAVRRFPGRVPLVEDAYATLTGGASVSTPQRAGAALSGMIELLQARADIYRQVAEGSLPENEPTFPARPELDSPVITYLSINGWRGLNDKQKAEFGRAVYDLAEQMVRLAPLLPRKEAGVNSTRLDDLIKELRYMTSSLQVMGKSVGSTDMVDAAQGLNKQATLTPAQPLMTEELVKLAKAMTDAKLLAPRPAPPQMPTGDGAAATPSVRPAVPGGRPTAPGAKPGAATKPAAPAAKPGAPSPRPAPATPAPRPTTPRPGATPRPTTPPA